MRKNIITLLAVVLSATAFAQAPKPGVGIGTKKVNPAAALEIKADKKGVLIPRVSLEKTSAWGLLGDAEQAMLVYNIATKEDVKPGFYYWEGGKWELITSQTRLDTVVDTINTSIKEQIEKITNIGGDDDKSFLVSFKPKVLGQQKGLGDLLYLMPVKDAAGKITGYTKVEISFADLVKGDETKTFIREVKKEVTEKNELGVEVKVTKVTGYVYFGEQAINEWIKANPTTNTATNITDDKGTPLDIATLVTSNVKNIFNDKETIKTIETIVKETTGVVQVIVKEDGTTEIIYKDKDGTTKPIDISKYETKTVLGKGKVANDGTVPAGYVATDKLVAADLKKGEIIYEYKAEDKIYYINMTSDIVNTFNDNKEIQNVLQNIVQQYINQGGNVYFGLVNGKEVLYTMNAAGDKVVIDIKESIIETITHNKEVIETIKEVTKVVIEKDVDLPTGEIIGGKNVYKGKTTVLVEDLAYKYDSTFGGNIQVYPKKAIYDPKTGQFTYENATDKFGRLLSVSVLSADGSVLVNSATEVTKAGENKFKFYFGIGEMYIPVANGSYDVVYEYLAE